jgi:predicted Zn finger-like uncharacterized protein
MPPQGKVGMKGRRCMIIQCNKCSAKFRFDDTLMRKEGVWVRCGLCQYEFFQSHPPASPASPQVKIGVPDAGEIQIDRDAEMPDARSGVGIHGEPDIRNGEPEAAVPEKVRSHSALRISACVLALLLVIVGMGFFAFPDVCQQAISELSSYLPWVEKEQPPQPSVEDDIRVEAVSQRFVANISMGNLRVVEGVAVNQSGHPVARLRVKATLVDTQNNFRR